ncbi:hypothetical protein [Trichormus azollae]
MRRPVTQITGRLDYELQERPAHSCRLGIYREFYLIYTISF